MNRTLALAHLELFQPALEDLYLLLGGAQLLGQSRVELHRVAELLLQLLALLQAQQAALHALVLQPHFWTARTQAQQISRCKTLGPESARLLLSHSAVFDYLTASHRRTGAPWCPWQHCRFLEAATRVSLAAVDIRITAVEQVPRFSFCSWVLIFECSSTRVHSRARVWRHRWAAATTPCPRKF